MDKYGPTINIVTNELIKVPKTNIPPALAPNMPPVIPNTVNIIPMIAVTAQDNIKVMIIKPA